MTHHHGREQRIRGEMRNLRSTLGANTEPRQNGGLSAEGLRESTNCELRKSTENCGCTHRTVGGNGIAGEGGIVGKGLRGEGCSVHPRPFAAFPTGSTLGLWPRPRSRPEPCAFLRSYTTFAPSWPFLFLLGLHGHYPWTHLSIPSCPLRIVGEDPLWGDRIVEAGTLGKDKELW